jgi:hypothetical protein
MPRGVFGRCPDPAKPSQDRMACFRELLGLLRASAGGLTTVVRSVQIYTELLTMGHVV